MAINLNDNVFSSSPKLLDAKWGPFPDLTSAYAAVGKSFRKIGMFAIISPPSGPAQLYWYKNDTDNLVPFSGNSSVQVYSAFINFPPVGSVDVIYVDKSESKSYYWNAAGGNYQLTTSSIEVYDNSSLFPAEGVENVIYIADDTNISYVWNPALLNGNGDYEILTGAGKGITSIERTSGDGSPGTTDTYTITYSDTTTYEFNIYNGLDGRGITSIDWTSSTGGITSGIEGATDTYTITYTDSTTSTFDVYNGADGVGGGGISYYVDEGTTNTYSITTGNSLTTNTTGDTYLIKFKNANVGASTLNVDSIGSTPLIDSKTQANLLSGDIILDSVHLVVYTGTNFEVLTIGGGGTADTGNIRFNGSQIYSTENYVDIHSDDNYVQFSYTNTNYTNSPLEIYQNWFWLDNNGANIEVSGNDVDGNPYLYGWYFSSSTGILQVPGRISFGGLDWQSIGKGNVNAHGGSYGISLFCTVGYELNWQAGYLSAREYTAPYDLRPIFSDSLIKYTTPGDYPTFHATFDDDTLINKKYLEDKDYSGIVTADITNWNTAYGWGDHASAGYMLQSTYDVDTDGVVDAAERTMFQAKNGYGTTLTKGTIVYLKTSSSSADYPEVLKANASTEAGSSKTIGAVYEDIAAGAVGYIITNGRVHNLNTNAYNVGDKLWLDTTDGGVTTTPPTQPNHTVFIGTVTRKQTNNGGILYAIQNGFELNELHNVLITTPATGHYLYYDATTDPSNPLWKNSSSWQGDAIAVNKGGTGFSSYTVGDILYANTTTSLAKLAGVAVGSVLVSGGVGVAPSWSNSPEVRSILLDNGNNNNIITLNTGTTAANYTLTFPTAAPAAGQYMQFSAAGVATWVNGTVNGVTTMAAIGAVPNANGASIASSTLTLQPASASFGGVVTTGTQTFAGAKTFTTTTTTQTALGTALNISSLYNNAVTRTYSDITSGADTTVTHTSAALLTAGTLVRLANVTGITGITANTDYYIYSSTATTLKLATSYANALAGTPIVTTGTYTGGNATLTVHSSVGTGTTLTFTSGGGATPTSFIGSAIDSVLTAYGTLSSNPTYDLVFRTMSAGVAATERFRVNTAGASVTGSITGSTGTLFVSGTGSSSLPQVTVSGSNSYSWIRFASGGGEWPKLLTAVNTGRSTGERINFGDLGQVGLGPNGIGVTIIPANSTSANSLTLAGSTIMNYSMLNFYTGADLSGSGANSGGFNYFVLNVSGNSDIGWGTGVSNPRLSIGSTGLFVRAGKAYANYSKTISEINRNTSTNTLFIRLNNVTSLLANQVANLSSITPSGSTYNGIVGRMLTVNGTPTYGNLVFQYLSIVTNATDTTLNPTGGVNNQVSLPPFITGTAVTFTNVGTTGLVAGTTYYVYGYNSSGLGTCKLALSYNDAINGIAITGSGSATGGFCSVAGIAANSTEGVVVYGMMETLQSATSFNVAGIPVSFNTLTGITGLTAGTVYYLYSPVTTSNPFYASYRLALSFTDALAGTPILTASGTMSVGTTGTVTSNSVTIYSTISSTYTSGGILDAVVSSSTGIFFDKDDDLSVSGTIGSPKFVSGLTFTRTAGAGGAGGAGTYGLFADSNITQKVTIATNSTNINIGENISQTSSTFNLFTTTTNNANAGFIGSGLNFNLNTRNINIGTGGEVNTISYSTNNITIGSFGAVYNNNTKYTTQSIITLAGRISIQTLNASYGGAHIFNGSGWGSASVGGFIGGGFEVAARTCVDTNTAASTILNNRIINSFSQPTLSAFNTGITVTDAINVFISAGPISPVPGTYTFNQVTITNSWGLWSDGRVRVAATTASTNTTSGALVVSGGVGIAGSLFGTTASFSGVTSITNNTVSNASTNGALVVTGGVGIGGALYVGGAVGVTGNVGFYGTTPVVKGTTANITGLSFSQVNTTTLVSTASTFGGYTLAQIAAALQRLGLIT